MDPGFPQPNMRSVFICLGVIMDRLSKLKSALSFVDFDFLNWTSVMLYIQASAKPLSWEYNWSKTQLLNI